MKMDCNLHETSNKFQSHVTAEVSNSSTIAGYKLVNNNKKDQDIDYKNLDFEYLISNTEIKVLEKCFDKISSFLDSASLELEFRNITKILEEILIRIVKDVNVLTTKVLYEIRSCRKLSKNIVKKANMYNSGIYFLACIYKQEAQNSLFAGLGGNSSKNILVYKKVYHASVPHYFSTKSQRSPSPPPSSSSLDSEESEKPYGAPSSLTDYFKSHSLNLILKFVKDKSQTSLVFSGLTTPKAEFVHSIFESVISDSINSVDVKKICPQLWEAVKIFGLKYEFSISYLDSSTDKKFLLLEKVEKDNASILTEIFDMETALSMPVTEKAIKKHRDAIKHLAPDFITSSLKKLNKFLKDETQASLIFSNVNARERRFLKNMINYCHSQKIKILFCREAQQLFDEIRISYAMKIDFKLKIKHDNLECGEKIIRLMKMPTYVNRPRDSRSWYPAEKAIMGLSKAEISRKRQKMDCDIGASESKERTFPLTGSKYSASINFQYAGDMSNNKKDESCLVLQSEKDPMLAKAMEQYSMQVIDPQPPQLEQKRGIKRIRRTTRTTQLVEALSVPVKSDKALKMMLGMGWKGGALGSRGDGITEPIMPNLNTVAGAGLGHVKLSQQNLQLLKPTSAITTLAVSKNKRLPYKFRQQFLGDLLELLKSKEDSKTIRFHPKLNKKEKSFLHHAMRSFAMRTSLKMTVDEQGLVDNILLQYEKDADLMVIARISNDKKEVVLLKRHKIGTLTNKKEITIPPEITDNDLCSDNLKLLDSFGPLCQSQKAHETYKFRITIILEMLKFIKNDSQEVTEMKFPEVLTSKQKNHIEKTICCINNRVKFGCNGCETSMSHEIKRNMGLFNLILKFSRDLKSFRVIKDYIVTKSKRSYTATTATINNNMSNENDNIRDENEDLYMEDNIEITDSNRHKTNQIIYQNHEISNKDDEYASDIFEDMNNSVNYSDNDGLNKNDAVPSNDEGIVVEYYKLINDTEEIIENKNTIDCQDILTSTDISDQSTIPNARIFKENNENLTTLNNSTDRIINKKVNKTDNTTKEKTVVTDSDDNSSDVLLVNATDKMSISGQSNDYSVLGIEDISMSEDKLTDWDVDSDDSEKMLNKNVSKLAEFKKKHLKKKLSKVKTDIRLVSLNKRFISTKDLVKHIQRIISYNIIQSEQFPLLKCYGIHKDLLIYSCHDKKSYDWLLDVCVANDIIMADEEFNKMSFKINWFYDVDDNYVFDMLDLYNKNISTDEWSVLKREELDDCRLYVVKMDKKSFNCLLESDLSLYAGVDKVQFKIVWE